MKKDYQTGGGLPGGEGGKGFKKGRSNSQDGERTANLWLKGKPGSLRKKKKEWPKIGVSKKVGSGCPGRST